MWRGTTILIALALLSEFIFLGNSENTEDFENNDILLPDPKDIAAVSVEEYIRRIHSMFDSGRDRTGPCATGPVLQTDELIGTKYRMWKRNADLINSILALPKDMNDAGR